MTISPEKAKAYLKAGLSVLPANRAQKRPCLPHGSEFQKRLPTELEVGHGFANKHDAICIVCGEVSGNLEVIDFDNLEQQPMDIFEIPDFADAGRKAQHRENR